MPNCIERFNCPFAVTRECSMANLASNQAVAGAPNDGWEKSDWFQATARWYQNVNQFCLHPELFEEALEENRPNIKKVQINRHKT